MEWILVANMRKGMMFAWLIYISGSGSTVPVLANLLCRVVAFAHEVGLCDTLSGLGTLVEGCVSCVAPHKEGGGSGTLDNTVEPPQCHGPTST